MKIAEETPPKPSGGIVRRPEACRLTGLSQSTLWRLVKSGDAPKPVQLSPRVVGWLRCELENWIAARAASRTGKIGGSDA